MTVAHPATAPPRDRTSAAHTSPGSVAIGAFVALSMAIGLLLLYALWEFWPTQEILKSASAQPVHIFGIHRSVAPEVRLLVVVAIAGALGGVMHSMRSLAWYVGHRGLKWRWMPYYFATMVLGAALASIVYLVIRGGFLGGNAQVSDTNPYGFAAVGALVGLFTEQALQMLRGVANQVFTAAPTGADHIGEGSVALGATTGTASTVTTTSATLEGDATSAEHTMQCHFDYGTTTAYGQTTTIQSSGAGESHVTASVNGLTPGTTYHFRLVVADETGKWTTGEDATFTTTAA